MSDHSPFSDGYADLDCARFGPLECFSHLMILWPVTWSVHDDLSGQRKFFLFVFMQQSSDIELSVIRNL